MIIIIVLLYRPLSQWKRRSDLSSSFTVEEKEKKGKESSCSAPQTNKEDVGKLEYGLV